MKIDKAIIIRINNDISKKYTEICSDSCKQHNLSYEIVEGIEDLNCKQAYKTVGTFMAKGYKNIPTLCCTHASHIKCWKYILKLQKPCVILEHDTLVLGDVTNIDIPDMAVVTFGYRVLEKDQYKPISKAKKLIQIPRSIGVHAYALSPITAKWLINSVYNDGVSTGIDRWLMMYRASGLPLFVCDPPQIVCWPRKSFIFPNKKHADTYNYPESLTESWHAGLKQK